VPDVFEFPCEFPVKVMGRASPDFRRITRDIVERHAGTLSDSQIVERLSKDENFIALTFTIQASSREQLDALYRELTASEDVLIAL
jgi:putative lipoic acid-binding regulatory protein